MDEPTYNEAYEALKRYHPEQETGGPHTRRVRAMRTALREFLRMRGVLNQSGDDG